MQWRPSDRKTFEDSVAALLYAGLTNWCPKKFFN